MRVLMIVGAIVLALGIAGIIWGVVDMADDRDVIDLGGDSQIVLDEGDFPPIGIAGVIGAVIGGLMIGASAMGRKKS